MASPLHPDSDEPVETPLLPPFYLIFDTETTGLPPRGLTFFSHWKVWPRLVQIAWLLFDVNGYLIERKNAIIRPEGFSIPEKTVQIHGITTQYAEHFGEDIRQVIAEFSRDIRRSTVAVAHNFDFDCQVVAAECMRMGYANPLTAMPRICTMKSSPGVCRDHHYGRTKWLSLRDLHVALFASEYEGVHNAEADAAACARCFFALQRQGLIDRAMPGEKNIPSDRGKHQGRDP